MSSPGASVPQEVSPPRAERDRFKPGLQLACAWMGPLACLLFFIGWAPLAGFLPPPHPTDSAAEIRNVFVNDLTSIRIGCLLMVIGFALIAPWGALIAMWTQRMERGFPLWTYIQLVCLGCGLFVLIAIPLTWGVAAYRPDEIGPETTRTLNDVGWFLFLFSWPPFAVWSLAVAVAIFQAGEETVFPRWTAYIAVWVALLDVPAGLMIFFKTGPLAYNGVIAMYIPVVIFFVWVAAMTWAVIRATRLETARRGASEPGSAGAMLGAPPTSA